MSSHHIVRENQEPALIIANGEPCSRALLDQLLGWSPLVLVLDHAMQRVMDLGIKVDVLFGDFDRDFDAETYQRSQYPLEIVNAPDQQKTDLEKAFKYLIGRGFSAVNVVWATGRRADHTLNNLTCIAAYKAQLKITIYDDYSKVYVLPKQFKKWYPKNQIISLMPIGEVQGITSKNLFYPLEDLTLTLGYETGCSNHPMEDGIVEIKYESGDLLMMECQDVKI